MDDETIDLAAEIAAEMDDAPRVLDLDLDPPITFAKRTFNTVHLVEPTGIQAQTAEAELGREPTPLTLRKYQMRLIAQVAKIPIEVVHQMRLSQIEEAAGFLAGLISRGRQTGET